MSIQSEIQRLTTAKSDLKQSIGNKGVTIPDEAPIDTYNHYVDLIEKGSGGSYNGNVEGSGDITVSFQYINQQGDTAYHHIKCNKGDTVSIPSFIPKETQEVGSGKDYVPALVLQGWCGSEYDLDANATEIPNIRYDTNMSAVYVTETGKTYIPLSICSRTSSQTSIVYNLYSYSRGEGTTYIDWGDGTVDSYTDVDTAMTTEHTYELNDNPYLDYVIAVWVDGERTVSFSGEDTSQAQRYSFIKNSSNNEINKIKGIYIGANVYPDYQYLLYNNYYVERVTIPNNNTGINTHEYSGNKLALYAQRLKNIFLPSDITTFYARFAYSLEYLSLSKSIRAGQVDYALRLNKMTFPNGCGSISFNYNMNVTKLVVPESFTSINAVGFPRIEEVYVNRSSVENGSITSLTNSPSGRNTSSTNKSVVNADKTFTNVYNNTSTLYFHNSFGNTSLGVNSVPHLFIYVPTDSLSAYKSATNWTGYSSSNAFIGV